MAEKFSKELVKHFGRRTIENWAIKLHQDAENFLAQRGWTAKAFIDDELFFLCLTDMLADMMRLKNFHEIDHANKIKQHAYAASWWLRRKPICFSEGNDESTLWANELFALTLLFDALTAKISDETVYNKSRAMEVARHALYHLKYRDTNPQTLELFLTGLNATV